MDCKDINELLSLYIDGYLTDDEKSRVEEHMCKCSACRSEYDSLKSIISQIAISNPQLDVPENFLDQLHNRIASESKPMPKIIKFNKSNVFKYSGIAACLSIALLSGTFFSDYYSNKGNYVAPVVSPAPQVVAVEATEQPPAVTEEPQIVVEPTAAPVKPVKNVKKPIVSKPVVSNPDIKTVEVVTEAEPVAVASIINSVEENMPSVAVIKAETEDKIVISKLPTDNVKKLAYVTNVSLATDSVDVEYLGTSFKFCENSQYNTKVFKLYDATKESMYKNSNICYERIIDYTDEYLSLAGQVNDIIGENNTLTSEQIAKIRILEERIAEIDSMIGYNVVIF